MLKKFIAATVALFWATASFAGTVAYVAPEVTAIEEPSRIGGSGAWIIPLAIIVFFALALAPPENNDDDNPI